MGALTVYLIKTASYLLLFYLFYRYWLSEETFHRLNRLVLLCLQPAAFVLPVFFASVAAASGSFIDRLPQGMAFVTAGFPETSPDETGLASWISAGLVVYAAGGTGCLLFRLYSAARIWKLIRSGRQQVRDDGTVLVVCREESVSFSWWKYIVISENDLAVHGREILLHETAHIRNKHSRDRLLADLCVILQWFNPAAWLLKRELQALHEYEADAYVLANGVNRKEYQMLLIRKAAGDRFYTLANGLSHSKLGKRIDMMFRSRSNSWARLKYGGLLPLFVSAGIIYVHPDVKKQIDRIACIGTDRAPACSSLSWPVSENRLPTSPRLFTAYTDSLFAARPSFAAGSSFAAVPSFVAGSAGSRFSAGARSAGMYQPASEWNRGSFLAKNSGIEQKWPGYKRDRRASAGLVFYRAGKNTADPIILVDGKEVSRNSLEEIDPDKIDNLSILQSRSAVGIYGDKGKNGVILIQTKPAAGTSGKPDAGIRPLK